MCLAVPGCVVSIEERGGSETGREGVVDFQGNRVKVSLALTPEAGQGDWVLVHAGFALQVLDEEEAKETWASLREAGVPLDGELTEGLDSVPLKSKREKI